MVTNTLAYYLNGWMCLALLLVEQGLFYNVMDYRGRHWKVSQFTMPFKSTYNKKMFFSQQKNLFEPYRKEKTVNFLYDFNILASLSCSVYLFRAALSKLICVLHKNSLFHFNAKLKFCSTEDLRTSCSKRLYKKSKWIKIKKFKNFKK
jgi:hypothetical protein